MKKFLLTSGPLNLGIASLIPRLMMLVLIKYGWIKIDNYHDYLTTFPDPIGVGPWASVHLVIFAEVVCPVFIGLGLFSRIMAVPVFIQMCVIYFIIHADHPFDEAALSFFFGMVALTIIFLGSGRYSVDYILEKRLFKDR